MKVYTKTGDTGTTSLVGGRRVAKDDCRVEAYGTVDELSAHVALLRDSMPEDDPRFDALREDLTAILHTLLAVGALLACDGETVKKVPPLCETRVGMLEKRIDEMSAGLPPLRNFILPGGHPLVSLAHVCRTVCRRAEREVCASAREYCAPETALCYLNRLSDYFYSLGRKLSGILHVKEIDWIAEG